MQLAQWIVPADCVCTMPWATLRLSGYSKLQLTYSDIDHHYSLGPRRCQTICIVALAYHRKAVRLEPLHAVMVAALDG